MISTPHSTTLLHHPIFHKVSTFRKHSRVSYIGTKMLTFPQYQNICMCLCILCVVCLCQQCCCFDDDDHHHDHSAAVGLEVKKYICIFPQNSRDFLYVSLQLVFWYHSLFCGAAPPLSLWISYIYIWLCERVEKIFPPIVPVCIYFSLLQHFFSLAYQPTQEKSSSVDCEQYKACYQ